MTPVPGIEVRVLCTLAELRAACALFDRVWGADPANPPMTADIARALTLAGNYAAGAYAGDELVGASVGFFSAPETRSLHSHVTGVSDRARGLGVGWALKLHQREWALDRGVAHISWTFDPLVRRNARFNLVKLAATVETYLPDCYGPIDDALNAGDLSDRLLVSWRLDSAAVAAACAGKPADPPDAAGAVVALRVDADDTPEAGSPDGELLLVPTPPDIEALRARDQGLAAAWRSAVREVLGGLLDGGARVVGFTGDAYLVRRAP